MSGKITKTIVVDAPPSTVFKALTDERELVRWMPQQAKMDARVGGEYEFKYYWPARNLDASARGKILELIPNKRLSYTFDSVQAGSRVSMTGSIVTWTLEELSTGKTRVTLVQDGITDAVYRDTDAGWGHFLTQLANHSNKMAIKA
jgi:uncharacterized protein YndB with AHSA1/START domain